MAVYAYRARSRSGELVEAQIDAVSADAAAELLLGAGVTPIRIAAVEDQPEAAAGARWQLSSSRVTIDDLIVFSRQMTTLTEVGLPLIGAIVGLAEGVRKPALREALLGVASGLESGRDLTTALRNHPRIFSSLFCSIISVGESTGRLDEAFKQVSSYLEFERETRRRIKTATRYPLIVLGAIVGAVVLINVLVLPAFVRAFESMGGQLPLPTRILIWTSNMTVSLLPQLAVLAVGLVIGLRLYLRTARGRYLWHRLKLKLPVSGSILLRATLARYARTFAMTAHSGLPLNRTLEIVAEAVDNDYVAELVGRMLSGIQRGESLTQAAGGTGLFPPIALQMISVGERSGRLAEMHSHMAETYEGEVDYDLQRIGDLLEPLLIVGVGAVVLLLALGIYLPMWDFSTTVK